MTYKVTLNSGSYEVVQADHFEITTCGVLIFWRSNEPAEAFGRNSWTRVVKLP